MDDFIAQSSQQFVRIRTPQPDEFTEAMHTNGGAVAEEDDGALSVSGLNAQEIGDIAYEQRLVLHELSPQLASLEEAYMERTHDSVEYRPDGASNDLTIPNGK